jgi:DNA polymerase
MIYTVVIADPGDLASFRNAARKLLAARIDPVNVVWTEQAGATLFPGLPPDAETIASVPRAFVELAEAIACHRDAERWSLLYQLLWRITAGERTLMAREADPLMHRLRRMAAAVRHDQHRMTAFVRFRVLDDDDGPCSVAWYEPAHNILRRTSPFFIDRFASLRFSIITPNLTLHWDRRSARFEAGLGRASVPPADAMEDWWKRYYRATFNPARANPRLLQSHIPKRFWRGLPEAQSIPDLLTEANARTQRMIAGTHSSSKNKTQ